MVHFQDILILKIEESEWNAWGHQLLVNEPLLNIFRKIGTDLEWVSYWKCKKPVSQNGCAIGLVWRQLISLTRELFSSPAFMDTGELRVVSPISVRLVVQLEKLCTLVLIYCSVSHFFAAMQIWYVIIVPGSTNWMRERMLSKNLLLSPKLYSVSNLFWL